MPKRAANKAECTSVVAIVCENPRSEAGQNVHY